MDTLTRPEAHAVQSQQSEELHCSGSTAKLDQQWPSVTTGPDFTSEVQARCSVGLSSILSCVRACPLFVLRAPTSPFWDLFQQRPKILGTSGSDGEAKLRHVREEGGKAAQLERRVDLHGETPNSDVDSHNSVLKSL